MLLNNNVRVVGRQWKGAGILARNAKLGLPFVVRRLTIFRQKLKLGAAGLLL
jgi:hypothetical protein